jgi:hypothetical protein
VAKEQISNREIFEKLEDIKKIMSKQLSILKLVNLKTIETSQTEILKLAIRKKIFDLCDNKKNVTQIATLSFPNEPSEKSQPKVSYHLAILEDYMLVDHRDDNGQRYYFRAKELG